MKHYFFNDGDQMIYSMSVINYDEVLNDQGYWIDNDSFCFGNHECINVRDMTIHDISPDVSIGKFNSSCINLSKNYFVSSTIEEGQHIVSLIDVENDVSTVIYNEAIVMFSAPNLRCHFISDKKVVFNGYDGQESWATYCYDVEKHELSKVRERSFLVQASPDFFLVVDINSKEKIVYDMEMLHLYSFPSDSYVAINGENVYVYQVNEPLVTKYSLRNIDEQLDLFLDEGIEVVAKSKIYFDVADESISIAVVDLEKYAYAEEYIPLEADFAYCNNEVNEFISEEDVKFRIDDLLPNELFTGRVSYEYLDELFGEVKEISYIDGYEKNDTIVRVYEDITIEAFIGEDGLSGVIAKANIYGDTSVNIREIRIGESLENIVNKFSVNRYEKMMTDFYGEVQPLYGVPEYDQLTGFVMYEDNKATQVFLLQEHLIVRLYIVNDILNSIEIKP